jgi:predicted enzyme related to lactoylglutathione lyase
MIEMLANIDVDNLEHAVDFYSRALGLEVGRRLEAFGAVEMVGASSKIYLLAKAPGTASSAGSPAQRNYQRHWTPIHLDFVVDDLDAAIRRAGRRGNARNADRR